MIQGKTHKKNIINTSRQNPKQIKKSSSNQVTHGQQQMSERKRN